MDALTPTQQHALTQLQTITNGEADVAKSVLESVDWDVQVLRPFPTSPLRRGTDSPSLRKLLSSYLTRLPLRGPH
jgi:hypothetical protein